MKIHTAIKYFIIVFILPLLLQIFVSTAYAYPQYIRLGYKTCIGCHYSPQGGGMLSPYGKGISSTQSFFSKELSEDDEEKLSTQKYFQSIQSRILNYKTKEKNRLFPMQLEYLGRYDFDGRLFANFTMAVSPPKENVDSERAPKTHERIYSRIAELSYKLDKQSSLAVGISPLPIGIGLIDHTAFVRSGNRLQITDIPVSARYFYADDKNSYNAFIYLPHYLEKAGNRELGFGGQYWYNLNPNFTIGFQNQNGQSYTIRRHLFGLLLKAGVGKYSAISEFNYTQRNIIREKNSFGQITHYTHFAYHPTDWSMISYNFQGQKRNRDFNSDVSQHAFILQVKINKAFTLIAETRINVLESEKTKAHLLQGFFQWW